jgi:ElaB/YqjD/DUF883 family membrane-anchored ribosome-binding protein
LSQSRYPNRTGAYPETIETEDLMVTTKTAGSNAGEDLEALKRDFAALRKDMAAMMSSMGDAANSQKKRAFTAAGEKAEQLKEKGGKIVRSVEGEIEARPLTSVGIAFGAGFLLGKLLDRR